MLICSRSHYRVANHDTVPMIANRTRCLKNIKAPGEDDVPAGVLYSFWRCHDAVAGAEFREGVVCRSRAEFQETLSPAAILPGGPQPQQRPTYHLRSCQLPVLHLKRNWAKYRPFQNGIRRVRDLVHRLWTGSNIIFNIEPVASVLSSRPFPLRSS